MRLLPPGDPFLLARDPERLFADSAVRRRVWTAIGGPGVVVVDGRLPALWRARRKGRRLEVEIEPLERLSRDARAGTRPKPWPSRRYAGARTASVAYL